MLYCTVLGVQSIDKEPDLAVHNELHTIDLELDIESEDIGIKIKFKVSFQTT